MVLGRLRSNGRIEMMLDGSCNTEFGLDVKGANALRGIELRLERENENPSGDAVKSQLCRVGGAITRSASQQEGSCGLSSAIALCG